MDFGGGEAVLCRDVGKANQRLHQGQLSGMIELEPWNTFAVGQNRGLGELEQLSAIDAVDDAWMDRAFIYFAPVCVCNRAARYDGSNRRKRERDNRKEDKKINNGKKAVAPAQFFPNPGELQTSTRPYLDSITMG